MVLRGRGVEGVRSKRLRVHFQGYGQTHHFSVSRCSELCERKEVELWRLRQSLINSIFCTSEGVKGECGGGLCDSYFERI